MMVCKNTYAIYDENDMIVFVGNSKECANFLGLQHAHSLFQKLKHNKKGKYKVYKVEDGD